MVKRMFIMLVVVGLVFGGIFGYKAFMGQMMMKYLGSMGKAPVSVSVVKAETASWQSELKAVGTLRAVRGVDIAGEVPGLVESVLFKSADEVTEGQVLVKLNTATDVAQLHALEAAADLAQSVYDRDRKQLEIQAVSQAVVDADSAELKSRRAQVAQQNAYIEKKIIKAPFTARLGIGTINPGQYLNPGEKIVTLQALDSLYADFYLPQQELARLVVGQDVSVVSDTYPDRMFIGKISAVNARVDENSRNIHVEARIANPTKELLPGMFVSVRVAVGREKEYLTLPQSAVVFNPYGETVYLIQEKPVVGSKPMLTVRQVFITVGETRGDQTAVVKGVNPGDQVVTSGQIKLRNGAVVVINNKIQPANESRPSTVD